ALDGVSLTVAALGASEFEVALIPTTIQRTILGRLGAGSRVNLETDYLVKAAVTWLQRQEGLGAKGSEFGAGGSG
ncbi:MAG: bifunctional 3,4-dihydroxy-2-butanone-4-phosphate synthase/GTP cyclohydrolase II, partial [Phycisphaerae bacterium]